MTSTPATAAPHTVGVLARLTTAGILAGRGVKPAGAGWQGTPGTSAFVGYVTVYPTRGAPEGTLSDRHRDLVYQWQVTAVGASAEQAETVADLARAALLGGLLPVVAGRIVHGVWSVLDNRPVGRDDQLNPPLFYAVEQFTMRTEPA